ncbi:hypothetical protein OHE72_06530, partial [Escherichia coli]
MKYKLLPCLLAIFLTGCDRTEWICPYI